MKDKILVDASTEKIVEIKQAEFTNYFNRKESKTGSTNASSESSTSKSTGSSVTAKKAASSPSSSSNSAAVQQPTTAFTISGEIIIPDNSRENIIGKGMRSVQYISYAFDNE